MDGKRARLVESGRNRILGGPHEVWDVGDGYVIIVDFWCPYFWAPDTMAAIYRRSSNYTDRGWRVLRHWPFDATGGKAIRELGYEIEEDE